MKVNVFLDRFFRFVGVEGLVPITRTYLAKFYDKYSFAPVSEDVTRLSNELRKCYRSFLSELPDRPGFRSILNIRIFLFSLCVFRYQGLRYSSFASSRLVIWIMEFLDN
jgi:hypothetical protein